MPEPDPAARPASMGVAVLAALDTALQIQARPVPAPAAGQALIRVRAAGVCHTDLHLVAGVPAGPPLPLVLGHEIAGEVVEAGDGVEFAAGDRVLVYYYDGCGRCRWCAGGLENLCRQPKAKWGFDTDGGFAQYLAVPARCLVEVPAAVTLDDAAVLGCSGTTGVHVIDTVAQVAAGETVTVIGVGGVGLAAVQVALARGARVVAVDPHDGSRAAARQLGAGHCVDPAAEDAVAAVRAATSGGGCDVVVDTVGNEYTPAQAVGMVRPQGRVVLVGYTGRPAGLDVAAVVTREARILGSVGATAADAREALRLAAAGRLRVPVADRYPLAEVNDALDRLQSGKVIGRLVLRP
ncbi:alcohol dehydrogenase catalytic domain-containing protein [Dactylosporangium sucinum]|uniref:alcohol dehydrogenase n=1 Tax=Dactylosporangium sucinum TaxID=1424081 RepID=A0A917UE85_9ACTN|nr:zinc-binding dehydrogenase [Dactylosporangium sucinum]GGM87009.1 NAD(P)-dependent alcohol dehydrogenase [Dactylosporangium sucinum]